VHQDAEITADLDWLKEYKAKDHPFPPLCLDNRTGEEDDPSVSNLQSRRVQMQRTQAFTSQEKLRQDTAREALTNMKIQAFTEQIQ
tara:strand:- start:932 stop:1189 length:258 start_codon:yes stop_codon:yes gene_type:complete